MKLIIAACTAVILWATNAYASPPQDPLLDSFDAAIGTGDSCGDFHSALLSTRDRLEKAAFAIPTYGKMVLVNIPAQMLYAYQDGQLLFESRVVVGSPGWKTPELDTHVTLVRLNPDWTVPQSIINARGWRQRVLDDPAHFANQNFTVIGDDGRGYSPYEISSSGGRAAGFVQQPGTSNSLGLVKFGLHNAGAIFLHDTNAKPLFQEVNRARSHGCVRVENALSLAAWILELEEDRVHEMVAAGDRRNRTSFPNHVRVVMGYWTTWPDADGSLQFYPDIYSKDGAGRRCEWGGNLEENGLLSPPRRPNASIAEELATLGEN